MADDGAVANDGAVYSSLSRAVQNLMRLNTDWQVDLEKNSKQYLKGLEYKTFCKQNGFDGVNGDWKNVKNSLKNVWIKTKIG